MCTLVVVNLLLWGGGWVGCGYFLLVIVMVLIKDKTKVLNPYHEQYQHTSHWIVCMMDGMLVA